MSMRWSHVLAPTSSRTRWSIVAATAVTMVLVIAVPVRGDAGPSAAPVVTAVSPNSGPLRGKVQVAVSGTNFLCGGTVPDPATTISFGPTPVIVGSTNTAGTP